MDIELRQYTKQLVIDKYIQRLYDRLTCLVIYSILYLVSLFSLKPCQL